MSKNKLYSILLIACFFGYIWLGFSVYNADHKVFPLFGVCIFKTVTSFPCPSCGTTRAIQSLLSGDFYGSVRMNPFGLIVALLMILLPIWIVFDWIFSRDTLWRQYYKTEKIINTKWIATLLILIVVLNWIWNINKGL